MVRVDTRSTHAAVSFGCVYRDSNLQFIVITATPEGDMVFNWVAS